MMQRKLLLRAVIGALALCTLLSITATCLLLNREEVRAASAQSRIIQTENGDPVTRFRQEREQLRQRQTSQLNDIIHDSANTDAAIIAQAQRRLMELMRREEQETTLEALLVARGFEGALVTVQAESVNILVRQKALTRAESAIIMELVLRETGVTGGNVKIIPINE